MAKKVDSNGFWFIKHNPISKEGVFPYLGHTISDECEPNKIYKVYRPASTLKDSVETWDNPPKPFIEDHEMLGEGFAAIDDRPVQGVINNPSFENGVLYADITVYSEDLKQSIENGKKELSLGYFCKYKKERGVFKGEVYDYVQYDMVGNHVALVDAGRCGSDVKVFDHKCTMDSLNLGDFESPLKTMDENGIIESKEKKGTDMYVSIDEVRRLLTEAFTYGDNEVDPKVELIMAALEPKAKQTLDEDETNEEEKKSEDSDDEEKKKAEDKCGKDEDEEEKKESEDCDEKKETADSIKELMSVVKDMADDIKKLVAKDEEKDDEEKKESEDGDDSDDESKEEKESEDEDEDEETKKSEDSAVFVFGQDSAIAEDEGLKEYLK